MKLQDRTIVEGRTVSRHGWMRGYTCARVLYVGDGHKFGGRLPVDERKGSRSTQLYIWIKDAADPSKPLMNNSYIVHNTHR
jgi:hypothetical protein